MEDSSSNKTSQAGFVSLPAVSSGKATTIQTTSASWSTKKRTLTAGMSRSQKYVRGMQMSSRREDDSLGMASRREVLQSASAALLSLAAVTATRAAIAAEPVTAPSSSGSSSSSSSSSSAASDGEAVFKEYRGPISLGYSFMHPSTWDVSKKVIKTHLNEVIVTNPLDKKLTIGVVVDEVKIDNIQKFGTPKDVGDRVVNIEKKKEGVTSAELKSYQALKKKDMTYYLLDYEVISSRGPKRFLAVATITGKNLYVMTAQSSSDKFETYLPTIQKITDSFEVKPQYYTP